jgi:hypothetical protein
MTAEAASHYTLTVTSLLTSLTKSYQIDSKQEQIFADAKQYIYDICYKPGVSKHTYRRPNNIKYQVCKLITGVSTSMHNLSRAPNENTQECRRDFTYITILTRPSDHTIILQVQFEGRSGLKLDTSPPMNKGYHIIIIIIIIITVHTNSKATFSFYNTHKIGQMTLK